MFPRYPLSYNIASRLARKDVSRARYRFDFSRKNRHVLLSFSSVNRNELTVCDVCMYLIQTRLAYEYTRTVTNDRNDGRPSKFRNL